MASFQKDPFATPFGRNEFLRSTRGMKAMSRTCSKLTVPAQTIDGNTGQKILQTGMVMAKIITGPEAGKVGPFQAGGTDEVQLLTGGGTISGGTFTLTVMGSVTTAIAWNANAATVQAAIRAAVAADVASTPDELLIADGLTVTGGPIATTPFTITYDGELGADVAQVTANVGSLTGAAPTITPSTSVPGVAGATDGRGDGLNIVGINNTFLPWQFMERDVEIAVLVEAQVYQDRCFVLNSAGVAVPLDDTTAAFMFAKKHIDIRFAV